MHAIIAGAARSDATLAALLIAHGLAARGPTLLVRIARTGEPPIPDRFTAADSLDVVQVVAADAYAVETAFELPAVAVGKGPRVVLDLPSRAAFDPRVAALGERALLAVGPTSLDEARAAAILAEFAPEERASMSLLGCSRPGGAGAATAFARRMAWHVAGLGCIPGAVAPAVTPRLGLRDEERLLEGRPGVRVLRFARDFAAALEDDRDRPPPDGDGLADRLRILADDVAAIEDGTGPTDEDLAGGPILEDWRYEERPRRALSGRVRGHPSIPDGRRILTSDVFASDGETFGRTLSRYYALGRRAP